jgi:circadian clock protein KaiB
VDDFAHSLPQVFKGIALFTPGGDLVYCIDPAKQNRWHLHLCAVLQDVLGLPEPPHFLVPCYTATLDQWVQPGQKQVQTSAEVYPLVARHQALLNAVFGGVDRSWTVINQLPEMCNAVVINTYRQQFPQLWESHELIVRCDPSPQSATPESRESSPSALAWSPGASSLSPQSGYVLRLFVSGHSAATERILKSLHQSLEQFLHQPYTLKVIDVRQHPEQVEADHIAATPTLLKVWPPPAKRIVGNLDDINKILEILVPPRKSRG